MLEPPAVRYVRLFVCLPLRIPCPSNRGSTPRGALRLNHSGARRIQCLAVYVTGIKPGT